MEEWFHVLTYGAVYARCQLEKGESGTHHIQACVGYKTCRKFSSVKKNFPGCHVEIARNAMAAWDYCGKEDTRVDGPLVHGLPPAAKNVRGDTKKKNVMILEYGAARAVDEGLVALKDLKSV